MTRIVLLFFATTHLLPFLIVTLGTGRPLPAVVAAVLGALFVAGVRAGGRSGAAAGAGPARVFIPHQHALLLSALAYYGLRASSIAEVAKALWRGTFADYALALALDRYDGYSDTSALYQLGTMSFFVMCGITGSAFGARLIRSSAGRWAAVGTVVLALFIESASLARAGVLLGLTLTFAFFLVNRREDLRRITWRRMSAALVGACILAAVIFLFSAYYRVSSSDSVVVRDLLAERVEQYLVAGHDAFIRWLWGPAADDTPIGFCTFTFLFKLFGARTQLGFFDPVQTAFGETNIFLLYRGLVSDFGVVGAALFVAGMGFAIGRVDAPEPPLAAMWLCIVALSMVLFPLISPFFFATFGFAVVFLLGVLRVQHQLSGAASDQMTIRCQRQPT